MHDVRICILHAQPSGRPVIDDLVSSRMTDARTYTHRTGVRSHVLADACVRSNISRNWKLMMFHCVPADFTSDDECRRAKWPILQPRVNIIRVRSGVRLWRMRMGFE